MKNFVTRLGGFVQRHRTGVAAGLGGVALGVGSLVGDAVAGATAYDPTSDLTTLTTNIGSTVGPIAIIVVGGMLGIVVLFWGIRFALSFIGGRHQSK